MDVSFFAPVHAVLGAFSRVVNLQYKCYLWPLCIPFVAIAQSVCILLGVLVISNFSLLQITLWWLFLFFYYSYVKLCVHRPTLPRSRLLRTDCFWAAAHPRTRWGCWKLRPPFRHTATVPLSHCPHLHPGAAFLNLRHKGAADHLQLHFFDYRWL